MKVHIGYGAILIIVCSFLSENKAIFFIYLTSAFFHEVGHILCAKALGIRLKKICLDFAGARIYPENNLNSYKSEWLLCFGGPLANLTVALVCYIYFCFFTRNGFFDPSVVQDIFMCAWNFVESQSISFQGIVSMLILFSVFQAFINLMPVSTLDGGRMFGCVCSYLFGESFSQKAVTFMSLIVSVILWMISVYLLLRVSAGLALFSFSLCMFCKIMENPDEGRLSRTV